MQIDIDHLDDRQLVYQAIHDGVRDALWEMINSATSAPCADFYQSIQDGAKKAMLELGPFEAPD